MMLDVKFKIFKKLFSHWLKIILKHIHNFSPQEGGGGGGLKKYIFEWIFIQSFFRQIFDLSFSNLI